MAANATSYSSYRELILPPHLFPGQIGYPRRVNEDEVGELSLEDYVAILRRRWVWVVLPVLALAGAAVFLGSRAAPQYTSTASVLIANSAAQDALGGSGGNTAILSRRMENEISLALGNKTEQRVEEILGFVPKDGAVRVTGLSSADVLEFTSTAGTADDAAEWANGWAKAYVQTKQASAAESIAATKSQLETSLSSLRVQRQELLAPLDPLRGRLTRATDPVRQAALQAEIDQLEADLEPELLLIDSQIQANVNNIGRLELSAQVASVGTASILQAAEPPLSESGAPLSRSILLGIVAGTLVGVALALLAESLDRSIKDAESFHARTGITVLGALPKLPRSYRDRELSLISRDEPSSALADGYQRISTALVFASVGKDIRSILIASPNEREGKTTTATNLAYSMSVVGRHVVLLDGDLRRPRLHKVFGELRSPGFSDHLVDGLPIFDLVHRPDGMDSVALLTSGTIPPNPAEFVASPGYDTALRKLETLSDLVIVDGPPVLPVADAAIISRSVDAVVLVASVGQTTREQVVRSVESITKVGGTVLGVILLNTKEDGRYGRYGYGYGEEIDK